MEVCKQLFDLGQLFEHIESVETVAASFHAYAKQEIDYRSDDEAMINLTPEAVLRDTIDTCKIIARRGGNTADDKMKFQELQKGITSFGTGFLMKGRFRIDDAVTASARVAYLAAKLLTNDLTPLRIYNGQDMKELNINDPDWNVMNRLKKQPDKSSFYYWYQAIELLTRGR